MDPIPTSLLKSCVDVLLTPITNIVDLSLKSGVSPDMLKLLHITPLVKKPSLSKDDMENYRPVSNLNFISKLMEKIIAKRIRSHLESNDLLNRYQSAYGPMHSTETALLKVQNDLLRNLDDGKTTVLVLLDLSAAFDTLDHSGVISLLENWYGISGNALRWFASYLMDRQQMVKVKECVGEPSQTKYGVPQGSVLGPLLFTLYTIPLSKIIPRHNVCHHLYADDTQIYITLFKSEPEMSLALLQDCLLDVGDWMTSSKLKLNPDKTEISLFGTNLHRKKFMKHFPAKLLDHEMTPTDSARNLGVVFDGGLNFRKHISLVCRSCYYHIRHLHRLRRGLTSEFSKTIATTLVSSKLYYCNGLFYNVTNRELNRFQEFKIVWPG